MLAMSAIQLLGLQCRFCKDGIESESSMQSWRRACSPSAHLYSSLDEPATSRSAVYG